MGGFKSNSRAWLAQEKQVLDKTEEIVAGVILTRATMLAPKDSGNLRGNGRVERNQNGGRSVKFGDDSVPYARIHELGGDTGRDHKTKIKAVHYLKTAGDSVAKENIKKYVDMAR